MTDKTSSPKLKAVRAEIEALLKKHDVAGHVVLHTPGFGEVFAHLTPSYSKISGLLPTIRIRSKAEDYGGDREAQRRHLEATANMVSTMATLLGQAALAFIDLSTVINTKTGAVHTDGKFTQDPDPDLH